MTYLNERFDASMFFLQDVVEEMQYRVLERLAARGRGPTADEVRAAIMSPDTVDVEPDDPHAAIRPGHQAILRARLEMSEPLRSRPAASAAAQLPLDPDQLEQLRSVRCDGDALPAEWLEYWDAALFIASDLVAGRPGQLALMADRALWSRGARSVLETAVAGGWGPASLPRSFEAARLIAASTLELTDPDRLPEDVGELRDVVAGVLVAALEWDHFAELDGDPLPEQVVIRALPRPVYELLVAPYSVVLGVPVCDGDPGTSGHPTGPRDRGSSLPDHLNPKLSTLERQRAQERLGRSIAERQEQLLGRVDLGAFMDRYAPAYGPSSWPESIAELLRDSSDLEVVMQLVADLRADGRFRQPIVVDVEERQVLNGMHRIAAAHLAEVPTIEVDTEHVDHDAGGWLVAVRFRLEPAAGQAIDPADPAFLGWASSWLRSVRVTGRAWATADIMSVVDMEERMLEFCWNLDPQYGDALVQRVVELAAAGGFDVAEASWRRTAFEELAE